MMSVLGLVFSVTFLNVAFASMINTGNGWDTLRVTFGLDPTSPDAFVKMPLTEQAAISGGWTKISDCLDDGPFPGSRYLLAGDYAVILIYNANGDVAGIQAGVHQKKFPRNFPPKAQRGHVFQKHGKRWFLTSYFEHPAGICTGKKTSPGLYIQWGPRAGKDSRRMPDTEVGVRSTASPTWTYNGCVPYQGKHYWTNSSDSSAGASSSSSSSASSDEDASCAPFEPVFLLYNKGKLNAFGWAFGTRLDVSPRLELVPRRIFAWFFGQCIKPNDQLMTLHIWLDNPFDNLCN